MDWYDQRAQPLLAREPESLTNAERNVVRTHGANLFRLSENQRAQLSRECTRGYVDAYELTRKFGFPVEAGACAASLGQAYREIAEVRDLDRAEQWFQTALALRPEQDRIGRGKSHNLLGTVAWDRFVEAREADAPSATLLDYLNTALQAHREALDVLPQEALADRATAHNQLGNV